MALEDALLPLLSWGSPMGLGIFFAGLGYLSNAQLSQHERKRTLKRQKASFRRVRMLDSDTAYTVLTSYLWSFSLATSLT